MRPTHVSDSNSALDAEPVVGSHRSDIGRLFWRLYGVSHPGRPVRRRGAVGQRGLSARPGVDGVCRVRGADVLQVRVGRTAPDLSHRGCRGDCNGGKIAHGGFVATLADSWLAWAVEDVLPEKSRIVTAVLTVDYLRAAHPGSCLEGAIDRVKVGRRLCHASGMIISNGRDIAAARGMFAVVAEA